GLHGLFRTVAREHPGVLARVVAPGTADPSTVAERLVAEPAAADRAPVGAPAAAGRHGPEPEPADPGAGAARGAGPEDPATAGAADRAALRAALAGLGEPPASIDARASRILARREITTTLAALRSLGCEARYQAADVRDPESVRQAVKDIRTRHGRLD